MTISLKKSFFWKNRMLLRRANLFSGGRFRPWNCDDDSREMRRKKTQITTNPIVTAKDMNDTEQGREKNIPE